MNNNESVPQLVEEALRIAGDSKCYRPELPYGYALMKVLSLHNGVWRFHHLRNVARSYWL